MHASWAAVAAREVMENKSHRSYRNHVAIAHRYACCVANDYSFPEPVSARPIHDGTVRGTEYVPGIRVHEIPYSSRQARASSLRTTVERSTKRATAQCNRDTLADRSTILMYQWRFGRRNNYNHP